MPKDLKSADDFINHAVKEGAEVKWGKSGFKKVTVQGKGSVHIKPGHEKLDPQTHKNLVRWFRLLGLLIILAVPALALIDHILYALGVRIALPF